MQTSLYECDFGAAVAERLERSKLWRALEMPDAVSGQLIHGSSFVAAIGGFIGSPKLIELDDIASAQKMWWMPVRLQERFLFAGPLIGPGTPCLRSFDKRTLMNSPYSRGSKTEAAVRRFRGSPNATLAQGGHTPAMVSMAAALLQAGARDPATSGGRCWQVDCLYPAIRTIHVVPVPGCQPRRGVLDDASGEKHTTVQAMVDRLAGEHHA